MHCNSMDQFDGIIAESLKPLIEGLRNARLSHNWSQADMAARSGISRSAYQNLENGYFGKSARDTSCSKTRAKPKPTYSAYLRTY